MGLMSDYHRRKLVDAIKSVERLGDAVANGDPWSMSLPSVAVGMSGKDPFLKLDKFHFMNNFLELAEFRHAAKTFLYPPITEESKITELFNKLDANGDSHLDPDEFYGRYNKRHFPIDTESNVKDALSVATE